MHGIQKARTTEQGTCPSKINSLSGELMSLLMRRLAARSPAKTLPDVVLAAASGCGVEVAVHCVTTDGSASTTARKQNAPHQARSSSIASQRRGWNLE